MRVLHLLSQLQPTGSEFYAVTLGEWQKQQGHEVYFVSDNLFAKTDLPFTAFPIGNRRWTQRIRNIMFVKRFIEEHQIDVVHAHSRAASWVADRATRKGLTSLVSTVHGRQHIHASSKRKNVYGQQVVAVCENIRQHLIEELNLPGEITQTVPNCLSVSPVLHLESSQRSKKVLSLIGRTTGPKGESASDLIETVFPRLLEEFSGKLEIRIIGGKTEHLSVAAQKTLSDHSTKIRTFGFVNNLPEQIVESDIVIASGRTAIEAVVHQKTVFALGESSYEGKVTLQTLDCCLSSNFGDVSAQVQDRKINSEQVKADLRSSMTDESQERTSQQDLADKVAQHFGTERVAREIEEIYKRSRALKAMPQHIPALMYHKVPIKPLKTEHKTYITKDKLENHLRWLKFFGYSPITLKSYLNYYSGKMDWGRFPKRPIFLTFDDGYLDNYENLLPLLRKYNVPITLFCLANDQVKNNSWDLQDGNDEEECPLMTFEQMQAFVLQGSEIGAHGLNHVNYLDLFEQGRVDEIHRELSLSKQILTEKMQSEIVSFAYPFGKSNTEIRQLAKEAGYELAVSTDSGGLHIESDHFHIFRTNVFPDDGLFALLKKASPRYRLRFFRTRGR